MQLPFRKNSFIKVYTRYNRGLKTYLITFGHILHNNSSLARKTYNCRTIKVVIFMKFYIFSISDSYTVRSLVAFRISNEIVGGGFLNAECLIVLQ